MLLSHLVVVLVKLSLVVLLSRQYVLFRAARGLSKPLATEREINLPVRVLPNVSPPPLVFLQHLFRDLATNQGQTWECGLITIHRPYLDAGLCPEPSDSPELRRFHVLTIER